MIFWTILGFLAPVFSLAAKGGMIHQAVKNFRRKNTDGLSVSFYVFGVFSYGSFALIGMHLHSLPVVIAQLFGIIPTVIVSAQALWYRKKTCFPEPDEVNCGYARAEAQDQAEADASKQKMEVRLLPPPHVAG